MIDPGLLVRLDLIPLFEHGAPKDRWGRTRLFGYHLMASNINSYKHIYDYIISGCFFDVAADAPPEECRWQPVRKPERTCLRRQDLSSR